MSEQNKNGVFDFRVNEAKGRSPYENMKELSLNYTAIGSLPFKDENAVVRAVDFIFENFSQIPFWPQLPHFSRYEDMVIQFSQNLAGLEFCDDKYCFDTETEEFGTAIEELYLDYETILSGSTLKENAEILDKYGLYEPYCASIYEFLKTLKDSVKIETPKFIKGSVTGPFTVSTTFVDKTGKCAFYDEMLRDVIVKTLTLKALWQIKEFNCALPDSKPIIFMDEPSISQLGSSAFLTVDESKVAEMLSEISNAIRQFGGLSGVHCCGKTDWKIPIDGDVDILNFDAYSFTQSVSTQSEKIKSFLNKGGILAFGIVPTLDKDALNILDENILEEKFEKSLKFLTDKGISKEQILRQSFITPSCGCGSLNDLEAAKALEFTKKLSTKLRDKYKDII